MVLSWELLNTSEKVPKIESKIEPTESGTIKSEFNPPKSDEINSNSCNNTVIEHLEDSMSAVDISAESFSSCTPSAPSSTTPPWRTSCCASTPTATSSTASGAIQLYCTTFCGHMFRYWILIGLIQWVMGQQPCLKEIF